MSEILGTLANRIPAVRYNPRQKAWDFHFHQGYLAVFYLFCKFSIKILTNQQSNNPIFAI
jgi:hypothetical protein